MPQRTTQSEYLLATTPEQARTHPVFNVEEGKVAQALRFFESQPSSHAELMKM